MNIQSHSDSYLDQIIDSFVILFTLIERFDLNSILRSIVTPFVFLFVCYSELIVFLTEMQFELPEIKTPEIAISPLFLINEKMQSVTVKNLRKMQSFPKSYKKQDMINALLITN